MAKASLVFSLMEKARTQMLFKHSFFARLAMELALVETAQVKRAATDGKRLFYNPAYVEKLTPGQRITLWVHEVLHPALMHHIRRTFRDPKTWNKAADYIINLIIKANNLEWIPNILYDEQYKDDSTESCYNKLMQAAQQQQQEQQQSGDQGEGEEQEDEQQSGDQGDDEGDEKESGASGDEDEEGDDDQDGSGASEDGDDQDDEGDQDGEGSGEGEEQEGDGKTTPGHRDGDGDGSGEIDDDWNIGEVMDAKNDQGAPMSEAERAEEERNQKTIILQAYQVAKSRGNVPAGIGFLVEEILNPKADWRTLLQAWVQRLAADDYTMAKVNRRYISHNVYVPGLQSDAIPECAFFVDTSGSCFDQATQAQFFGELSGALESWPEFSMHLGFFDTQIYPVVDVVTKHDMPLNVNPKIAPAGGGGTSFEPIFEWVEKQGIQPAFVVVLTDLMGSYPSEAPPYPVLWVSTYEQKPGDHYYPPFGDVIFIDED